jgi:hypothetical protein
MADDDTFGRPPWLPYRSGYRIGLDHVELGRHGMMTAGLRPMAEVEEYARRVGWIADAEMIELMRRGLDDALAGRDPSY